MSVPSDYNTKVEWHHTLMRREGESNDELTDRAQTIIGSMGEFLTLMNFTQPPTAPIAPGQNLPFPEGFGEYITHELDVMETRAKIVVTFPGSMPMWD